jgi:hypothetical protein
MDMSPVFWMVTVVMAVTALLFLVLPVVRMKQKLTPAIWVAAIALPALAIGLYFAIGKPAATGHSSATTSLSAPGRSTAASENITTVESLLSGLEQRLEDDPSDAKGWLLLAKSYEHLQRPDDAAAAYARAKELGRSDSDFEAKLASSEPADEKSPIIRGRLTVAEMFEGRLDPDDSIFIFAKSTDGSPIPVAVLRRTARDLPFDFELSDKQSMSADAKLSSTPKVTITARVSKSGNAMEAEPGLEVISQTINVGDDALVELQLGSSSSTRQQ